MSKRKCFNTIKWLRTLLPPWIKSKLKVERKIQIVTKLLFILLVWKVYLLTREKSSFVGLKVLIDFMMICNDAILFHSENFFVFDLTQNFYHSRFTNLYLSTIKPLKQNHKLYAKPRRITVWSDWSCWFRMFFETLFFSRLPHQMFLWFLFPWLTQFKQQALWRTFLPMSLLIDVTQCLHSESMYSILRLRRWCGSDNHFRFK